MGLFLLVIGIGSAVLIFFATLYSLAQAMLGDGWLQRAHLAALILTLIVMGALYEEMIPLARIAALPLLCVGMWCFWLEKRWFKVFPLLTQLFALTLVLGFVAL
ncbi:MAG: hypothetical protein AAF160_21565 [Pseudomonadota bacterium]